MLSICSLYSKSFRLALFALLFGRQTPHIGLLCCGFVASFSTKIAQSPPIFPSGKNLLILHSAFCILYSAFCILHFAFCILHFLNRLRFSLLGKLPKFSKLSKLSNASNRRQTESRGCLHTMPRCEGGKACVAGLTPLTPLTPLIKVNLISPHIHEAIDHGQCADDCNHHANHNYCTGEDASLLPTREDA